MKVDQSRARAGGDIIGRDKIEETNVFNSSPTLADESIRRDLFILKAGRHFAEYNRIEEARRLAQRCTSGELASGSDRCRGAALAWCARILTTKDVSEAKRVLAEAQKVSGDSEIDIAKAFIASHENSEANALSALAEMDSSSARSASLFIVANHRGKEGALKWYEHTGLQPSQFDSDGKNYLLGIQLERQDFEGSRRTAHACSEHDCEDAPALWLNLAFVELIRIVPKEYGRLILTQVPFEMATFDLNYVDDALETHRRAEKLFALAAKCYSNLGLNKAAGVAEQYEFWLALRHPELREEARSRLRQILDNPSQSIKFIPLAINFNVDLNLEQVEKELNRQIALNGGPTPDTAVARLSLSLTKKSRQAVLKYINEYRPELAAHIEPRALAFLEIEMLSRSGQSDAARKVFDKLSEEVGLSDDERARLELVLSEASDVDPIMARRKRYEESRSLSDLRNLITILQEQEEWNQLAEFAATLYQETGSLLSAEQLVEALVKAGRDEDAIQFLDQQQVLLSHSLTLNSLRCWALYRTGRVLEAREVLKVLLKEKGARNYYELSRNIAIAVGDWKELARIIGDEADYVESRSPQHLLQSAYLGFQVGAPQAEFLLFKAAAIGHSDPNILAAAYFLATNAGLEENEEVAGWLHRASKLSGDEGPIYSASLKEILERQPEWERRRQGAQDLVHKNEAPLFIAAQTLNRSLIEMMLTPLLVNSQELDPRKRVAVPAFSGKRVGRTLSMPETLGLDASVLLTLGGLGLLDKLNEASYEVRVPHSTLEWLLAERQRVAFHQPSRFIRARRIQELLLDRAIATFSSSISPDQVLCTEVGTELASMICDAKEFAGTESDGKSYVVCSFPVRRVGSLLEESADLSAHQEVLVSCLGVVRKLQAMGRITNRDARRAESYLSMNETRWPAEPEIESGSGLYLDSLSVTYLQACGVLEKLSVSGFDVRISSFYADEARTLLAYQRMSDQVRDTIEAIRELLEAGIADRTITLGAIPWTEEDNENELRHHPTFEAMLLVRDCDAVIIDDRYLNQHANLGGEEGSRCPIYTSIDLLKLWRDENLLEDDEYQEAMTKLRSGGFLFIDVDPDEVFVELERCQVKGSELLETAELRSIREAFVFARMSGMLTVPDEAPWLNRSVVAFIIVYRRLWSSTQDYEGLAARLDWLMPLIDVRPWLHCFPYDQAQHILHEGRVQHLSYLIVPPSGVSEERCQQFMSWADEYIVAPLKREDPVLYGHLLAAAKNIVLESLDKDLLPKGGGDG